MKVSKRSRIEDSASLKIGFLKSTWEIYGETSLKAMVPLCKYFVVRTWHLEMQKIFVLLERMNISKTSVKGPIEVPLFTDNTKT